MIILQRNKLKISELERTKNRNKQCAWSAWNEYASDQFATTEVLHLTSWLESLVFQLKKERKTGNLTVTFLLTIGCFWPWSVPVTSLVLILSACWFPARNFQKGEFVVLEIKPSSRTYNEKTFFLECFLLKIPEQEICSFARPLQSYV